MQQHKILILGSIASGKTTLARQLAQKSFIPIIHIDQLEFNLDLTKKSNEVIREELKQALNKDHWILDGYGPLDMLPLHLQTATMIIFLDLPLYKNIYNLIRRQLGIRVRPRSEMPLGANEWQWNHYLKMYQSLRKQHKLMNPELRRILNRSENKAKLITIHSKSDWNQLLKNWQL